jgi:hypothetical protein
VAHKAHNEPKMTTNTEMLANGMALLENIKLNDELDNHNDFKKLMSKMTTAAMKGSNKVVKQKLKDEEHLKESNKAPSSYNRFVKDKMPELKAQYPNMTGVEIFKKIGALWTEQNPKKAKEPSNPTKTLPSLIKEDRREIKERVAANREPDILNIIKLKQQYPAISLERAILKNSGMAQFYYKDKRIIDLFNLEETVLSSSSKSSSSSKKEQSPPKFLDGSRCIQKQLLDNLTDSKNELRKPKSPPPFPKRSTIQQPKPSKRITGQLLTDSKNKLKHKSKSPKKLNPIDPNYTIEMMFRDMNKPS